MRPMKYCIHTDTFAVYIVVVSVVQSKITLGNVTLNWSLGLLFWGEKKRRKDLKKKVDVLICRYGWLPLQRQQNQCTIRTTISENSSGWSILKTSLCTSTKEIDDLL